MARQAVQILNTPEAQLQARVDVGLPDHFCTPEICAHCARDLSGPVLPKVEKFYVRVFHLQTYCSWSLVRKGNDFVLRDAGTETKSIEVVRPLQDLQRIAESRRAYDNFKIDNVTTVLLCVVDIKKFLHQ